MKEIHIFTVFSTVESFFDGQFKYLASQGEKIIIISTFHTNAERFVKRNNIRFIPVEMPRSMSPIKILKAIYTIVKIIKKEKPDVVFGHTPVGALCAMTASMYCGIKNRIYYRHGLIYTTMTGVKRKIFRYEEQFVSFLSTAIINVSHSLSRLAVCEKLNKESKQYVIGHGTCGGIDSINVFNPMALNKILLEQKRNNLKLNNVDIVFGFCGRICNDKGIPELVEGFKMFQNRNSTIKAKLLLIGRFDLRDEISKELKKEIEFQKDIIVTGMVSKEQIPYFYALLDVFVFPSHREGFGMCVIEASAMRKPILVSHAHGCEDSIIEHETGEYIDLTPKSICTGMEYMLDSEIRKYLGESGRKNVLEKYDSSVMWPLIWDLYKKILK